MNQIVVNGCSIEYTTAGTTGPVVVLLHGLIMDQTLWTAVVDDLSIDHQCVIPTLPMGAHRQPVPLDVDLSLAGLAKLVEGFIAGLDLHDVVLAGNDTGGALAQLVAVADQQHVTRLVLVSCEAFDNIPPGLAGKTLFLTGRLSPVVFGAFMQQLRLKPLRRLPISFGWLTKRGDRTTRQWLQPILTTRAIRRDTVRLLRAANRERTILHDITSQLGSLPTPTLIMWARDDKVMPPEHGQRLAELIPNTRHVEVADTRTLIPLDQPHHLAAAMRSFISDEATARPV
jgi:pimeloyl-ACP methyl ester carboxylesterase